MNELKLLTRKTLESTFRVQYRQLVAEKMKVGVIKDRIKGLIRFNMTKIKECEENANRNTDFDLLSNIRNSKNEINGRLRALLAWLDGNSQFQFQKETKDIKPTIKVSYGNLYWGICGILLGFFTSNAVHALLKIWGMSR